MVTIKIVSSNLNLKLIGVNKINSMLSFIHRRPNKITNKLAQ